MFIMSTDTGGVDYEKAQAHCVMRRHYLPTPTPHPAAPMARSESSALYRELQCTLGCTGYIAKRPIGSIPCQSLTPTVPSTLKTAVFCKFAIGGCSLRLSGHSLEEDCLEGAKDCSAVALIYFINCCLLEAVSRLSRRR
jgi:hypothetical protein